MADELRTQFREVLAQERARSHAAHAAPPGWPPQTTHTDRQRSVAFREDGEDAEGEQPASKRSKNSAVGNATNPAGDSR